MASLLAVGIYATVGCRFLKVKGVDEREEKGVYDYSKNHPRFDLFTWRRRGRLEK